MKKLVKPMGYPSELESNLLQRTNIMKNSKKGEIIKPYYMV